MQEFYARLRVLCFSTMIAGFAAWAGLVGILKIGVQEDILAKLIGSWVVAFQVAYLFAGLLVLVGLGRAARRMESAGLVLLLGSVLVRAIALAYFVGANADVFNAYIFDAWIVWASLVRLRQLKHGDVILLAKGDT